MNNRIRVPSPILIIILLFSLALTIEAATSNALPESRSEADISQWEQTGGPVGGIINTIEINPENPNELFVGGAGGSVFKSTNGGSSWTALPPIVSPSGHIRDILLSSANPETVYALAGQLYKSENSGASWTVASTELWFTAVALDHSNDQLLIGTTYEGRVYRSSNGGRSWAEISGNLPAKQISDVAMSTATEYWVGTVDGGNGRLYHTINSGSTWGLVDLKQPAETEIHTIFVDPHNTDVVYVGLRDTNNEMFDPQNDRYLLKTTNGGNTWTPLYLPGTDAMVNVMGIAAGDTNLYIGTGGTTYKSSNGGQSWTWIGPEGRNGDMYDIAVHPQDNRILYLPRQAYGIVKSVNGGEQWEPINAGLHNISISLLATHPTQGGRTLYATTNSGEGTFKSTDYGDTWIPVNDGITHPWSDELVVAPINTQTVWQVADVGEVFRTTNGGSSWNKIINPYGDGFRYGSVYAIASSPSDPDVIFALKNGFGIFKSEDGGVDWQFLHQSEIDYTYSLAIHPTNPDVLYSGYNPKPFEDWAMVRQTSDGGDSWRTALHLPQSTGVTSVFIDPNDPNTVYAGSTGTGGEVWVSRNAGHDWSHLSEPFDFTNVHALTVDPSDPSVAYAALWGGGTFKTEDTGQSWQRLPNDPTISAVAILVDPTDSDVIYVADRTSPRIYRTTNGGSSWATYFDAGSGYYRVLSAAMASDNPNVLYVSVFGVGGPMTGDLFRIENGTASNVTNMLPRLAVGLAVDPTDADTVYAALHGQGVYKTINGGQGWSAISGAGSGLPQTPHVGFNGLVVDPANPATVYLLGGSDVDTDLSHTGADPAVMYTVYKSTNGGTTWTNLNDGNLGANSNSIKGLTISPTNSDVLYLGGLNGVFRSTNGGTSWAQINSSLPYTHTAGVSLNSDGTVLFAPTLGGGLYTGTVNAGNHDIVWATDSALIAEIYHVQVAVDPTDSQTIYASAYPGGIFKSINGGDTWMEANFGLANFEIADPSRQGYYAMAIAPSNPDVLYLGLYGIGVYQSLDGAGTWRPINGNSQTMREQPITSLLVDTTNPNQVYISTEDGIITTSDGGKNWSEMNSGLLSTDVRVLSHGAGNGLYAGSRGYELFKYNFGSQTWSQMNGFGRFGTLWPIWDDRPLYQYTTLLFHPTEHDIVYVGTFPAGIYKSEDGGDSWREHNVGWTNDGVFSLVFHPNDTDIIYAGTYNGVNRSVDGGLHWETWNEGWPAEQWVFSIDFDPQNPSIMYACSKNGENEGRGREEFYGTVMKSVDGGASWFPITNGLGNQEFYKIIVDKVNPDIIYLATQFDGVYISYNGGTLWEPWNDGLTNLTAGTNGNNVTNTMVVSSDGRYLFFGSAGSGVFRRELDTFSEYLTRLPFVVKDGD